jgi:DNA sulfur modification protein DndD
MLLRKLILTDIGTYAGRQEFDLVPRTKYGAKRPIILFGGLNGSGKTTFLTAVRLALYGRQSLDIAPTRKEYEEYLLDLIHRPKHSLVRSTQGLISLEFEYARMGERATYRVARYWEERAKNVEERLVIYRNDSTEPYLSDDQAQAFLNQLVPPGVAQFFFFDGEKIAALAKDDTDVVLADAIRRLLGLDLIDRLNSDLSVFLRGHRAALGDKKLRDEISTLEADLEQVEDKYRALDGERAILEAQRTEAREGYHTKKADLSTQGGAWSVNRNQLEEELVRLRTERRRHEDSLREALNGVGIFELAPKLCASVAKGLKVEGEQHEGEAIKVAIASRSHDLKMLVTSSVRLSADSREALVRAIDEWIAGFGEPNQEIAGSSTMSSSHIRRVQELLGNHVKLEHQQITSVYDAAELLLQREEKIQHQLAHAPSDVSINSALEAVTQSAQKVGALDAKWKALIEEQRKLTWKSIDLVRKLRKCETKVAEENEVTLGHATAEATQRLIAGFKSVAATHKCELLRSHFVKAFARLARKDDIIRDAQIDSETFRVTLIDRVGREVAKKRLSAGEKQIYSIAMLEALAKTSGRNLPIIIDTPLGRLDSKHRTKLVESYFPVASHQVIVLSTDTEVDAPFYEALSNKISHAYHLAFDEESGATEVQSGYFWRQSPEVNAHAS